MDEFYLEGGFEAPLNLVWEHESSTPAACLEVEKRKEQEEEQMGYPADSCQALGDLLAELKLIRSGIKRAEYRL